MIFFKKNKFELAYVATAESGKSMDLYRYKLGFYRLRYTDIGRIFGYAFSGDILFIIVWVIVTSLIVFCLYKCFKQM